MVRILLGVVIVEAALLGAFGVVLFVHAGDLEDESASGYAGLLGAGGVLAALVLAVPAVMSVVTMRRGGRIGQLLSAVTGGLMVLVNVSLLGAGIIAALCMMAGIGLVLAAVLPDKSLAHEARATDDPR